MKVFTVANFESDTKTIGQLLDPKEFYKVPSYQRPYSWETDQFDDLVLDIKNAPRNQQYFLGTIVLHKDTDGQLAVVDGQQRLTSLLILLACLRDSIEDDQYKAELQDKLMQKEKKVDQIPERVRLEVKNPEIFQKVVIELGGTLSQHDTADLSKPEVRYLTAAASFHQGIAELTQDQKKEYVSFISNKCVVIYLLAENFEQAFRLFEVVNDRGKQLRRVDVLKALTVAPEVIAHESIRTRVSKDWEDLEEDVGEEIFESVFFLVRLIYVKDKPQSDLLREFENRIFSKGLISRGEKFADLIFDYVKLYRDIFIDKTYLGTDHKFSIRYQSLIHIMDKEFAASEWRACVLSFAKKFGRDHIYQFCLAVEKLFLTQWVGGIRKDERYGDYTKLLAAIETGKNPELVIAEVAFDATAIVKAITRTDVYGANFCKYALLRLELVTTEHDVPKLFSARSIEHVFPQKPKADSKWLEWSAGRNIEEFANQIGNLVLLSKGRNSSASNLEFEEKKKKYLKPRVSDYPRSNQVMGYDKWSPEIIEERTASVAKQFLDDL